MILLIHGAGASSNNFNYLSLWLDQELQTVDYQVGDDHETIFKKIQRPNEVTYVIGHSYGGLLGAEWLSKDIRNVKGLVSIATPWQGSPTARILQWFLSDEVWKDMNPGSDLLRKINSINLTIPVKNIVAAPKSGNGLAGGIGSRGKSQNDGTIPVASARAVPEGFRNAITHELPFAHGEIMQTFDLVEQVRMFIDEPMKDVHKNRVVHLDLEVNRGY
jgi:pimeloyl-ACP methyl ester carboxylesterase|tara:strand:+ start:4350 stop:5003 length:654 start_codon:yes stop_codon:yes gene_type:complete